MGSHKYRADTMSIEVIESPILQVNTPLTVTPDNTDIASSTLATAYTILVDKSCVITVSVIDTVYGMPPDTESLTDILSNTALYDTRVEFTASVTDVDSVSVSA